ncbi:MAG: RHS repeat-associated core domain-containing protein, partial [Acidimicrobiia bacterium]
LQDPHGDVIATFQREDRLTGTRTYSPWGEVRGATGDAAISPFGFQGDWTDPGTGQVDMGARMYEPDLGRFTTMDPLFGQTTNPLSLNRFTYGWDNPVSMSDPDGLCPHTATGFGCDAPPGTSEAGAKKWAAHEREVAEKTGTDFDEYDPKPPQDTRLPASAETRLKRNLSVALNVSRSQAAEILAEFEIEFAECLETSSCAELQGVISNIANAGAAVTALIQTADRLGLLDLSKSALKWVKGLGTAATAVAGCVSALDVGQGPKGCAGRATFDLVGGAIGCLAYLPACPLGALGGSAFADFIYSHPVDPFGPAKTAADNRICVINNGDPSALGYRFTCNG